MYRRRCYRSQESTSESHASIRRSLSSVQQRDQQTRRERIKNPLFQGRETTVSWIARKFDALAGAGASFFTSLFIELTEGFLALSGFFNKE
jgi:hypothetical protein